MAAGWIRSSWRSCFDILDAPFDGISGRVAVGIGVAVFAVAFLGVNFAALAKVRG